MTITVFRCISICTCVCLKSFEAMRMCLINRWQALFQQV